MSTIPERAQKRGTSVRSDVRPARQASTPQGNKLQLYNMMVQYGLRHHAYLDVAKYYTKSGRHHL